MDRYRVEYRLGGRESAIRYGGSFKTMREAMIAKGSSFPSCRRAASRISS
jgi:hypothetical protein